MDSTERGGSGSRSRPGSPDDGGGGGGGGRRRPGGRSPGSSPDGKTQDRGGEGGGEDGGENDWAWADGVAIFYRVSRFELVGLRSCCYRDDTRLGGEAAEATEVGLVAAFVDRRAPETRKICVAATELCDVVEWPHVRLEQTYVAGDFSDVCKTELQ